MHLGPDAQKILSNSEEFAQGETINMYHIMLGLDLFIMETGRNSPLSEEDRKTMMDLAKLVNNESNT